MMRSLSSAVAGLRTHQTKMDVIGNNIANVNTYGFKASRTTFSDVYYQTLGSGRGPSGTAGGTNPTQIGYGSSVATIDIMNTQSGMASTDRAMDVYITGDGFLVTQDANGNYMYTRLGNMGFDDEGNLVDSTGNYVMGFPYRQDQNGNMVPDISADGTVSGDQLSNIRIDPNLLDKLTSISISAGGEITGVLPGDAKITLNSAAPDWLSRATGAITIPPTSNYTGSVRLRMFGDVPLASLQAAIAGSNGNAALNPTAIKLNDQYALHNDLQAKVEHDASTTPPTNVYTVTGTYTNEKGEEKAFTATARIDAAAGATAGVELKDTAGNVIMTVDLPAQAVAANAVNAGALQSITGVTFKYEATVKDKGGNVHYFPPRDANNNPQPEAVPSTGFNFDGITIQVDPTKLAANNKAFQGIIAQVGATDGEVINVGCIVLAQFKNANGLKQVGTSSFVTSPNSGEAQFMKPGLNGLGDLKAGNLEMSNVDISKEFTDMITTQRGFQANTRIVTVSDEMLQELVNLKR